MPDVVDAFQNDYVTHTRLGEDVASETRQSIHSETYVRSRIVQKPVAPYTLVQDSDGYARSLTDQPIRKDIRPTTIRIDRRPGSIGNGIAERHDRSCTRRPRDIETGQEDPGSNLHGV